MKKIYSLIISCVLLCFAASAWGEQLNEGFESSTFPPDGWSTIHVSGAKSWARSTGYKHGGGASAFMSYDSSGHENYLITPQLAPASGEELSFYAYAQYNYPTTVKVEVSTTDKAQGSFSPIQTYTTGSGKDIPLSWTNLTIDLSDYVGQNIYIAFHVIDADGTNLYIDDVSGVSLKPETCPKTGTPTVSEITASTATISWTPVGAETTWNLRYKKANTASWTEVNGLSSTTYNLTTLSSGTTYNYEVQADCGGGDKSEWKAGVDFSTECGTATLPFEPTITAGSKPNCWTIADASWGDGWSGRWYTYVYSSKNCLRYQGAKGSAEAFVQTPSIVISGKATLKFKYANYNSGRRCPAKVYISDGTTSKTVTLTNTDNATLVDAEIDLSNVSGTDFTGKTITIKFSGSGHSSSSGTGYVWIADIQIEAEQDCSAPKNVELTASTTSTADFSWTANSGVDSYKYCVVAQGAEPDFTADLTANTNSAHVEGLSTGNYTFYVKCACGTAVSAAVNFSIVDCPAVTEVTLSNPLYNGITVNWTSGASACDVQYKATSDADWTSAGTGISSSSKNITGLSVGTTYTFEVKPTCSTDGWVAAGETYAPAYGVPAPSVSGEAETQATVSWDAVYGATGYQYMVVAIDAAHSDWSGATNTNDLSATLPNLIGGSNYDVWVRSNYSGNYSAEAKATFTTTKVAPTTLVKTGSTTETISFSWSYAGSVNQFQWKTSKAGSEWSAVQSASSATATGLESGTSYTIYVRTYYADGIYSDVLSGTMETECATKSLPVQEEFASGLPTCWETTTSKWSAGYFGGDGSDCMAFDAKNHSNIGTLTTMGIVIPSGVKAELTFKYRNIYGSSNTRIESQVNILDNADNVLDNTSNVLSKSIDAGTTAKVNLEAYAGQTIKIQFQVTGVGSVSSSAKFFIDDVKIQEKPCPQLADDLAAVPTPDGATITWSQGEDETQYQYCVVDEGETPVWSATGILEDGVRTVTIEGKTFGNVYDCYVRSYCSATMQSEPRMVQFTPSCVAPTALTISAVTDESATLSWTSNAGKLRYIVKGNTGDSTYVTLAPAATSYDFSSLAGSTTYAVQVQAACASNGAELWSDEFEFTTKCAMRDAAELPLNEDFSAGTKPSCWEFISTTEYPTISSEMIWFQGENEQIVVLPGYDIELKKLSLTFTYTSNYASIELGYLATADGTFNSLGAVSSGVEKDLATVGLGENQKGYLAIRYFNTTSEFATGSVDNVVLRKTPSCFKPTAVAGAPGVGSASISWTENGSADVWNLQYKTGSADWTTVAAVTENPYALGGLEQGITYKVRVQAACAGEETSDWSSEAEFTTNCADVTALPFIETFDATLSNCWDITDDNSSTYPSQVSESSLNLPGGRAASGHLVKLPNITASLASATMTIVYHIFTDAAVANAATPQVGYMNGEDFVELEALTKTKTSTEARIELASADGHRLAIRFDDGASETTLVIEEIRILEQLALADNENNTETLVAYNGKVVDITIGRTFVCADYFNTICLPFSLSAAELAASPIASNDLWAFKYARVEGGELLIRIVEAESINAGEPYLISWPEGDNIENPLFKNVTISASVGKVMGNENLKFVGTLKPETFAAHDDSKLFLYQNNTLYWWNGDAASSLKSFRAFFTVEGGAGEMPIKNLPARIIKEDEEEQENTAIDNTKVDAQAFKFIENDQVVIIRNGVKYNIHGQVIEK